MKTGHVYEALQVFPLGTLYKREKRERVECSVKLDDITGHWSIIVAVSASVISSFQGHPTGMVYQ